MKKNIKLQLSVFLLVCLFISKCQAQSCPANTPYMDQRLTSTGTTCISLIECFSSATTVYAYDSICTSIQCPNITTLNSPAYTSSVYDTVNHIQCTPCPSLTPFQMQQTTSLGTCTDCSDLSMVGDYIRGACFPISSLQSAQGFLSSDSKSFFPSSQKCKGGEYLGTAIISGINFKQCIPCDALTPFQSIDGLSCVYTCPTGSITSLATNECLSGPEQCLSLISENALNCISACSTNEYAANKTSGAGTYQQCTICDSTHPLFSEDGSTCYSTCPQGYILYSASSLCLATPDRCPTYISADETNCIDILPQCFYPIPITTLLGTYQKTTSCSIILPSLAADVTRCQATCGTIAQPAALNCLSTATTISYLSSDASKCVSSCADGFYAAVISGKSSNSRQCTLCPVATPYQSSDGLSCLASCPPGYLTLGGTVFCYSAPEKCPTFVSVDKTSCISSCDAGSYAAVITAGIVSYKQCMSCPPTTPYQSKDQLSCSVTCPTGYITEPSTMTCLTGPEKCTLYVSADGMSCVAQCDAGFYAENIANGLGLYKQCQQCPTATPYSSIDGLSCLIACPAGFITQSSTFTCLSSPGQCTTFISADSKYCISQCPPSYFGALVSGTQSYYQCSKCQGTTPFTSSDGLSCSATCPFGFITQASATTCLSAPEMCPTFVSVDGTNCILACNAGEYSQTMYNGAASYEKCKICDSTRPYFSENFAICYVTCPIGQITQVSTKVCLTAPEKCPAYISISTTICVLACDASQYAVPVTVGALQYFQCTQCPAATPYQSQDALSCSSTCPPGYITQVSTFTCYPTASQCPAFVSIDGNNCDNTCNAGFSAVQTMDSTGAWYFKCTQCASNTPYQSLDYLSCSSTCPAGLIMNPATSACLTAPQQCPTIISADGSTCIQTKCDKGYYAANMLNGTAMYKQCTFCGTLTPYQSPDGLSCSATCTTGQIPYATGMECLLTPEACPTYISKDGKSCIDICGAGQIYQLTAGVYNTCSQCPSNASVSYLNACVSNCPSPLISDELTLSCLTSPTQCTLNMSSNGQFCTSTCLGGEYKAVGSPYGTCTQCDILHPIQSIDQLSCLAQCPAGLITDKVNNVCLTTSNQCTAKLSSDNLYCNSSCPMGEIFGPATANSFKQCSKCSPNQFVSVTGDSCLAQCPANEVTDMINTRCLASANDCTANLSSNNLICSSTCLIGEKISVIVGKTYKQCYSCPNTQFVSADGSTCLTTCPVGQVQDKISRSCYTSVSNCTGKLSSDNSICDTTCQVGEIYQPTVINVTYIQCTMCATNQYVSVAGDSCLTSCLAGQVTDQIKRCCLVSSDSCTANLSSDNLICSSTCQVGEIPQTVAGKLYQQCTACPSSSKYVSFDGKSCLSVCPTGQIADETISQCLGSADQCNSKLSLDLKTCSSSCLIGQNFVAVVGKTYQQCQDCLPDEVVINSGANCSKVCAAGLLADANTRLCISPQSCLLNLSSDSLRCSSTCLAGEYIVNTVGVAYGQCTLCPAGQFISNAGYLGCTNVCPNNKVADQLTHTCLTSVSQCTLNLSVDLKQCISSCQIDEIMALVSGATYKQCQKCPSNKPYVILNQTVCSSQCEVSTNLSNKLCFSKLSDCTGYILADGNSCDTKCPINHSRKRSADNTYSYCSPCTSVLPFVQQGASFDNCVQICDAGFIADEKTLLCIAPSSCILNISSDSLRCSSTCLSGEYIVNTVGVTYGQCTACPASQFISTAGYLGCTNVCPNNLVADQLTHTCLTSISQCTLNLSVDRKSCLSSCKAGEITTLVSGATYKQCQACPLTKPYAILLQTACSSQCEVVTNLSNKQCLSNLSDCTGYILADGKSCDTKCPINNQRIRSADNTYSYCSPCTTAFPFLQLGVSFDTCVSSCNTGQVVDFDTKTCMDILNCSKYVSNDLKFCQSSCSSNQFIYKSDLKTYSECRDTCSLYSYTDSSSVKRCRDQCPSTYIQSEVTKSCITEKAKCQGVISSDGNKCLVACNALNYEYTKDNTTYKVCVVCRDFFSKTSDGNNACNKGCGTQIAIPSEFRCVPASEVATACKGYKMSASGKKCTVECEQPEVASSDGTCKLRCNSTDSTCHDCETGEVLLSDSTYLICQPKSACLGYISSDNQCVSDCRALLEKNSDSDKTCVKCKSDENYSISSTGVVSCKKTSSMSTQDKENTCSALLKTKISSLEVVDEIKKLLRDVTKSVSDELDDKSDHSDDDTKVDDVQDLAKQFIQALQDPQLQKVAHVLGDSKMMTVIQKYQDDCTFIRDIDITTLITDTDPSLVEESDDPTSDSESLDYVATTIIQTNPVCDSDDEECLKYPVVKTTSGNFYRRRALAAADGFSIVFKVDQPTMASQYVCLSYTLSSPSSTPTVIAAKPSSDGTHISCPVIGSGSISVLLDLNCRYLDKTICDSSASNNSLSAAAIAGLVIGTIAFACLVAFAGYYFIRRLKPIQVKNYEPAEENTIL